ncbi:hypothetical protein BDZ45DRAFT_740787 [Acephala macrosclerotiorum]|nr:hypothetical protein BDZ45DRAFT_740787 [Acephala macrosclerotiorum]
MLFVFGPTKDSWIIGNDTFTMQYGMPSNVGAEIESGKILAKDVQWCSVGQAGVLCFYKWSTTNMFRIQPGQGDLFFSQTENLKADLNSGGVEHVTFASGGSWFVRYRSGKVRLSMEGTFPAVFDEVASPNMTTKGSSRSSLQDSTISNVFFGADDAILIQLGVPSVPMWANQAALKWRGLPANLVTNLTQLFDEGWVLSKRTNLCSWNKEYFYVEWTKPYSTATKALYQLPPHAMLPALFVRQMWEGEYPTSIPQPAPEKPLQSKPEPPALPPRNKSETPLGVTVEMIRDMCNDLFEQWSDSQDTMDGQQFKAFCQKLLPKKDLARVWSLSDADGNGTFSRDEFTIAVYLIMSRKRGSSLPQQVPYEYFLKAQEPNESRCARRTFLVSKDFKPTCTLCDEELTIGCWKCANCQACTAQGLPNGLILCVQCFCNNDTTPLTEANHKPVWTKIVRANIRTPEIKQGMNFCSLCGKINETGRRIFYYCENRAECDFDSCKSCYGPGQLCPSGHPLATGDDDDDLGSGIESMNLNGASSNPFLNDDDDEEENETGANNHSGNASGKPSKDVAEDDQALRGRISSSIVKEKPNVKWEDVAGLEKAKEEL